MKGEAKYQREVFQVELAWRIVVIVVVGLSDGCKLILTLVSTPGYHTG